MSTTLHLTGQVILTDSTGTRLPSTDLATALDRFLADHRGEPKRIFCTYTAMSGKLGSLRAQHG